jgi:type VI secretion system protein ImpB
MARKESTQHVLDRVRSPRVQITYDLEVGGAIQLKEIPFVVGVLGDFTGKPTDPLPPMKERKFVNIDRDNFNQVLAGMKPHLAYKVDNKLTNDDTKMGVDLNFKSLDDFEPEQVVNQVEPLRKLLDARRRLSDLVHKLDGNDKLDEILQNVVGNTESLKKVGAAAGVEIKTKEDKEGGNE